MQQPAPRSAIRRLAALNVHLAPHPQDDQCCCAPTRPVSPAAAPSAAQRSSEAVLVVPMSEYEKFVFDLKGSCSDQSMRNPFSVFLTGRSV
jgi:hypothetical protein